MSGEAAKGYEYTYQSIVHRLAGCDLAEAAARLGFPPPVKGVVTAPFLGRDYEIGPDGVRAADGGKSDPTMRGVLVYYITSKGRGEPVGSYSLPGRFSPGIFSGGGLSWMAAPLLEKYGGGHESLGGRLEEMGARFLGEFKRDEYRWQYTLLPKIPVQVVFREADEEFPCEIQIMMDDGAGRFLEFEQIAFLCGCFFKALSSAPPSAGV